MRMTRSLLVTTVLCIAAVLGSCSRDPATGSQATATARISGAAAVDAERLGNAGADPDNWMTHGRTYAEDRFSPLTQINADNVESLGLAWYFESDSAVGTQATPLVADGIMYTTSTWNVLHAIDAATGEEIWRYDPQLDRDWIRYSCCGPTNRGPALWKGRVYIATTDGRLVAVDATNGELAWQVQTTDRSKPYSITGAPRVVRDKVIIGNSGAEFGVRGYVTAYDAETGEQAWRFWIVPGNPADGFESPAMEMAAKTWSGEWWIAGGGGTAWDSFSFDPELNLLYIGTGNGAPWSRELRSPGGGDNLFLCSIIAVNADSGEYVWHYQAVPAENWDYNCTQQMTLIDLEIDGRQRKVLMQAAKNGFFYVLDRTDGELISANNFVPVNWASHIDMATGRPVEIEENLYGVEEAKAISPGPFGAHVWHSMSYSPETGLVYIPAREDVFSFTRTATYEHKEMAWNLSFRPDAELAEGVEDFVTRGILIAWDPVSNSEAWRIPHQKDWNGGVLSTAGNLLIQGAADGRLVIYRATDGEQLWEMPIHTGAVAAPISYAVDGEQYIAIAAGWSGAIPILGGGGTTATHNAPMRVLSFKLGGTLQLPGPPAMAAVTLPELDADEELLAVGSQKYAEICATCHGFNVISGGMMPDLRYMDAQAHEEFAAIVLGGSLADLGMASFSDSLTPDEVDAIYAYIVSESAKMQAGSK
ncbi:MAG: PQQ-dependent dehydrogenase, methanol/ethanol family [Woeseiaceae bacterium]|nr:PQQ-dependent dehydrogenase, methanol/ethanol family [Woeseiaceae bacterium]